MQPSTVRVLGFLLLLSSVSIILNCTTKKILEGQILIREGHVVDGSGDDGYKADILIAQGKVIWIGDADGYEIRVDRTIDASKRVVTPAFIDIHAHGDPREDGTFENFLAMGVTTIALGMDGSSVRSSDMMEWMNELDTIPLGVNIIPFIGHGTVRSESGIGISTDVSEDALQRMTGLVDTALQLGCWGLSMGLEYVPGYYADSVELRALARIIGAHEGMITSHIRNEDNDAVERSLDEMIALAEYCKVNISHLKVVYGKGEKRAKEILRKFENIGNQKYPITADIYPYTASYTGIGIVFPQWAKNPRSYKEVKGKRGNELLAFLKDKVDQRNGPEATLFGTGPYAGKTLQDLVIEYNRPYEIILRDIIGPYGASAAYFVMDTELQNSLVKHHSVMIGSDGSPTMRHPRGYGSFAKVLEEYVLRDSILRLEEAIYKMSGLPAATLGMEDRGIIRVGSVADILIFDPAEVRNTATFADPYQLAQGIDIVIMNGVISREDGQIRKMNGRLIRRTGSVGRN